MKSLKLFYFFWSVRVGSNVLFQQVLCKQSKIHKTFNFVGQNVSHKIVPQTTPIKQSDVRFAKIAKFDLNVGSDARPLVPMATERPTATIGATFRFISSDYFTHCWVSYVSVLHHLWLRIMENWISDNLIWRRQCHRFIHVRIHCQIHRQNASLLHRLSKQIRNV